MIDGGEGNDQAGPFFLFDDFGEPFADLGDIGLVEDFAGREFHLHGAGLTGHFKKCRFLGHLEHSTDK